MGFAGFVIGVVGAAVLFYGDRADWPFSMIVILLAVSAALMGFFIRRSQLPVSLFFAGVLVGSELLLQNERSWASSLYSTLPSLGLIALLALVCSALSCTVGGLFRSFVDAPQN